MNQKPKRQHCETCKWHDVHAFYEMYGERADGMGDMGICRRNPPIPGVWRLARLKEDQAREDEFIFAEWPETSEEDFCGEWKGADETP